MQLLMTHGYLWWVSFHEWVKEYNHHVWWCLLHKPATGSIWTLTTENVKAFLKKQNVIFDCLKSLFRLKLWIYCCLTLDKLSVLGLVWMKSLLYSSFFNTFSTY